MKLLLTSSGLTNPSLIKALEKLLDKPVTNTKLAFIPTAANVEPGDKGWMIDDLQRCKDAGCIVDIVDISAVAKEIWLPRLQEAEILLFGGGNTFHLMHWFSKSGLEKELPGLLKTKIYAGISAGSCIAGPTIYNKVQNLLGESYELEIKRGLELVPFQFIPHLNSSYFPKIRDEYLQEAAKTVTEPVYALDNQSAIMINGDSLEVISEGEWKKYT